MVKFPAEAIKISHDWSVEMPAPWEWRKTRVSEMRETSPVIETERLWRVPRQVEKELRNQCRCLLLPLLKCDTHTGGTSCCTQVVFYLLPSSVVGERSNEPRTANRERNKRMHAERGNIGMVVANVTALQRHWPILEQKADWLALTEVRVRPVESANECGRVSFCCKTLVFGAVVHDEDIPEMKWLRETKTATQKITVYVLVVYGLQGQLEMRERKNEELYNACTRTVLRMGDLPTFMVGDLQRDPSGASRQLMMAEAQGLLFDVAEHLTQGTPEATYSDGRHESRLDYVFANTSALRAVKKLKYHKNRWYPNTSCWWSRLIWRCTQPHKW